MTLRKALLAATMLALPAMAQAQQPVSGLYVGAGAGINYLQDPEVTSTITTSIGPTTVTSTTALGDLDTTNTVGVVGVLALGWGFGNGLRAELEGNIRQNEVNGGRSSALGVTASGTGGYVNQYGVMVNALYDFNGLGIGLVPYVGVGVGAVLHELDNVANVVSGSNSGVVFSGRQSAKTNEWTFAYQAIAGLALPLGVPGLALTAEYRFFGSLQPEATFSGDVIGTQGTNRTVVPVSGKGEIDNFNHSVLLGIRYAFGAAPPPVVVQPPPPPPEPARTYLVFFDWSRAELTDRARQIITEAAQNARKVQSTRIEVAGHADRSGPAEYNMGLSRRRAEAVAAELVRQGINRNEIAVSFFGETKPLVPTADGVREPQNRRVEIVLR